MGKSTTPFHFEYPLKLKFPPYQEMDKLDVYGEYTSKSDFEIQKIVWGEYKIFSLIEGTSLFDDAWERISDEAERWIADDIADKSSPNREDDTQDQ